MPDDRRELGNRDREEVAQRLAAVRRGVLGADPPPQGLELFRAEQACRADAAGGRADAAAPITITARYVIRSHRPVLGRVIVPAKRVARRLLVWLIEPLVAQINPVLNAFQSYFESHEQRLLQMQAGIREREERAADLFEHLDKKIEIGLQESREVLRRELRERLDGVEREREERAADFFEHLDKKIEIGLQESREVLRRELRERSDGLERERDERAAGLYENLQGRVDLALRDAGKLGQAVEQCLKQIEEIGIVSRLRRCERDMRARGTAPAAAGGQEPAAARARVKSFGGIDHLVFQQTFRGNEALIRERQKRYVGLFAKGGKVLDVGCGRGEFLQLLGESGVPAYGIDVDPDLVALCADKGLDARLEDAESHLSGVKPGTLGGIFCAQVLEHLDPAQVVALAELSFQSLRPGGMFVAETLNPASLGFLDAFYRDPTHVRPFPLETVRFILEAAGFAIVGAELFSPVQAPSTTGGAGMGASDLSHLQYRPIRQQLDILNERLFGPTEYAVYAKRPDEE